MHRLLPLVFAAALVVIDQVSKAWVVATVPLGVREHTLGLGFHITHTRNSGAAFGLLRDLQWVVGPVLIDGTVLLGLLNLLVSVALVVYLLLRGQRLDRITRAAAVLVLAGAAGNMIDRLRLGYVVDFVDFQVGSFDFAVFNVADACIVIGAGLLLVAGFLGERGTPAGRAGAGGDRSPTDSANEPHEATPADQVGR
ncbi:MAG: signal peptidase II [Trueperaceae bacterium]|nr:MAG: signal peptidase II [Trueperaceae bacterium]